MKAGSGPKRSEMRRCGKQYDSELDAVMSKAWTPEAIVYECPDPKCGRWHMKQPKAPKAATRKSAPKDTGPSPAVRATVRARDEGCCVRCGVAVGASAGSVHHRKRRSQFGLNETSNLILLCGSGTTGCHGWVHANPKAARESGWLLTGNDTPALVLVTYATPDGPERFRLGDSGVRTRIPPRPALAAPALSDQDADEFRRIFPLSALPAEADEAPEVAA